MSEVCFAIGPDLRIVSASAAADALFGRAAVPPNSIVDLLPPRRRRRFEEFLRKALTDHDLTGFVADFRALGKGCYHIRIHPHSGGAALFFDAGAGPD
jgi:hypothetical protein